MGQLDASIVTLTYQPLRTEFGASLAAVQWVSLAYLLTLATLLIPVGRLADAHGRKLMYLYGFVIFTAASAACGLAPGLSALIAFRIAQGVGAALLQANSVALVTTSAPPGRARAALGVQGAAQAVGLALGPTIGGLLVSTLGWRWVFGINVPVGIVAVAAGVYLLPRTTHRTPIPGWDRSGLVLLATATTTALLVMSDASGLALPRWGSITLVALAAASTAGFVLRERRAAAPLLELTLLRVPTVSAGLLAALGGYLILFGPLVLIPVVLTDRGLSELSAGLILTALPAGFAFAATTGERLLPATWTDRARCLAGALLAVTALAGLAVTPLSAGWLIPLLAILGVALGIFTPANNTLFMQALPAGSSATSGGLLNMARSLGTALGVALVTMALQLRPAGPHLLDGPRSALLMLTAVAASLFLITRHTR